jgi:hypothetical protein
MIANGETGMDTLWIETLFGARGEPMGADQMTLRAIVNFAFGVLLLRYSAHANGKHNNRTERLN